jgi:hypothetical protein
LISKTNENSLKESYFHLSKIELILTPILDSITVHMNYFVLASEDKNSKLFGSYIFEPQLIKVIGKFLKPIDFENFDYDAYCIVSIEEKHGSYISHTIKDDRIMILLSSMVFISVNIDGTQVRATREVNVPSNNVENFLCPRRSYYMMNSSLVEYLYFSYGSIYFNTFVNGSYEGCCIDDNKSQWAFDSDGFLYCDGVKWIKDKIKGVSNIRVTKYHVLVQFARIERDEVNEENNTAFVIEGLYVYDIVNRDVLCMLEEEYEDIYGIDSINFFNICILHDEGNQLSIHDLQFNKRINQIFIPEELLIQDVSYYKNSFVLVNNHSIYRLNIKED